MGGAGCRGEGCGFMKKTRRREGRRERGSLGADKKIRFQGFLCRKSRLADEKRREGRRDRVHG